MDTKSNKVYRRYPVINGIYDHYKGGKYEVLFLSNHSETNEILVNYKSLLFGSYHSKPLDIWNESTTSLLDNTKTIQKYELVY